MIDYLYQMGNGRQINRRPNEKTRTAATSSQLFAQHERDLKRGLFRSTTQQTKYATTSIGISAGAIHAPFQGPPQLHSTSRVT